MRRQARAAIALIDRMRPAGADRRVCPHLGPRRSGRANPFANLCSWRNAAVTLLVLMVAVGAIAAGAQGPFLLAQEQPASPNLSPARGHAQVVAQGVDALPAGEIVWRVAYHTARPFPEAPVGGRDLGFLVADQGALMVAEPATGRQTLLAPGEASFVPDGAEQQRGALDGQPANYYALELAPVAAADQVGTGLAVYASPPFAAPSGERDLNLVRDVLAPDEATSIAGAAAPVLVLATLGMIRVESSDGAAASLRVGEAAAFEGDLSIRGEGLTDAAFVAAVIGRDIAAPPAASPVATPSATGSGLITAVVHACPADTLPGRDNLTQCPAEPKAISLSLAALDGPGPRDVGAPIFNDGVPTWSGLPLGDYLLRATAFAPGSDRFFAPGLGGLGGPPEAGYPASPEMGYRIRLTEGTTSVRLDVYAFAAGADATQPAATGTPGATSPTATAGPGTPARSRSASSSAPAPASRRSIPPPARPSPPASRSPSPARPCPRRSGSPRPNPLPTARSSGTISPSASTSSPSR